ncbi:MAG: hypothetical protein OS112_07420 [Methanoregula sp.]|nr:MAG: hypothetical protein OS112_07420 [Methanoregula sp.]
MTSSPLHTISRKAAKILNRRGYDVVWSITLREWDSPETFVCKRGAEDTLHVKLKLSPNTLTDRAEIVRYCDDEIRILRRLMRTNPNKTGEHYEVWLSMPFGKFSAIEVLPETLIDLRSGVVLSPCPPAGGAASW